MNYGSFEVCTYLQGGYKLIFITLSNDLNNLNGEKNKYASPCVFLQKVTVP